MNAKILMVDNYDSFTYNIVQYFGELGSAVTVVRNDEVSLADITAHAPTHLVISPGPCSPAEAGISVAAIQHFAGQLPILGVCLGHQAIGAAFGGKVVRAQALMHGLGGYGFASGHLIEAGLNGFDSGKLLHRILHLLISFTPDQDGFGTAIDSQHLRPPGLVHTI